MIHDDEAEVYLDNWAIYDLAEGDASRRKRSIEAIGCGVELLFSVANAAEDGKSGIVKKCCQEDLWNSVLLN
jgi:hypothetical protein